MESINRFIVNVLIEEVNQIENYHRSFDLLIKRSFKLNIFYYGLDTQI